MKKKNVVLKTVVLSWLTLFVMLVVSCRNTGSGQTEAASSVEQTGSNTDFGQTEATFTVEQTNASGTKALTVKTGTVRQNGKEVENWVLAKDKSEVAVFLILMYSNNLDYMRLCSRKLSKDKVHIALSAWESCGGAYMITVGSEGEIAFLGGTGNISEISGSGTMEIQTIQEKSVNPDTGEEEGKFVVSDITYTK